MYSNCRQKNSKRAALPELTLHLDPPPVILNNGICGIKPKPQATRNTFVYFGGEARFKHTREQFRHYSTPGIGDSHPNPPPLLIGPNSDPTWINGAHCLDCVVQQIQECLFELPGLTKNQQRRLGHLPHYVYT